MSKEAAPPVKIRVAKTKDEIEACYDLRIEIFAVEQGFPLDTEIDEYDPISTHFMMTIQIPSPPESSIPSILPSSLQPASSSTDSTSQTTEKVIGSIRWTSSVGKISRIVVAKEYRSYGLGRMLVGHVGEYVAGLSGKDVEELGTLREEGGNRIIKVKIHAQMYTISFYEKLGYVRDGEVFIEDGADHQRMIKDIELKSA